MRHCVIALPVLNRLIFIFQRNNAITRNAITVLLITSFGFCDDLKLFDFNYKVTHLRDPFTSPAAATSRGTYGAQAKIYKQTDVERQFDPSHLILKAVLTDKKGIASLAIVSKRNNPQENYLIEGVTVKHLLSGLTIKNYKAAVQKNQVALNKVSGGPVVILKLESNSK